MIEFIVNLILVDTAGLIVQLFFTTTIVFMLIDFQKPPVATSIMTGIALIIFGLGGSIPAPLVAGLSVFNGLLWLILGFQRYNQKNKKVLQ